MIGNQSGRTGSRAIGLLAMLAAGLVVLLPQAASAAGPVPFIAVYSGEFTLTFGTAANGDNDLVFSGAGFSLPFGLKTIDGHSTLRPTAANPLVSDITSDVVTLSAANGNDLVLVNSGQDTLDNSDPNHLFIYGSGTFNAFVGAWPKVRGPVGSGSYAVLAAVTEFAPDGSSVGGTFYLVFVGAVAK